MSQTLTSASISEHQDDYNSNPFPRSDSEMEKGRSGQKSKFTASIFKEDRDFGRAEIDTSAPFESVKEAASRFGGMGFWKPRPHRTELECEHEDIDIFEVEKQKTLLAAHLAEKEHETFGILKKLEHTNRLAGELKSRLQKELSEQDNTVETNGLLDLDRLGNLILDENDTGTMNSVYAAPVPEIISMESNQEKMMETSVIKASIELLNESIESERNALKMTQERLATNSLNISCLEKELDHTRKKLDFVRYSGADGFSGNPLELDLEIHRLTSETEELKKLGEASKSELFSAMLEIEQTKSRIKIAEMSLAAANTMKEAAKKAEEAALSELKRVTNDECPSNIEYTKPGVSLSREEYEALVERARDAEQLSNERVKIAMLEVDEANVSKMEMLMKVERATEEVKMNKIVMENALRRVETATAGKLVVEESLRQWRSDKKRHVLSNSTKFKTVGPSQYRKEHNLHDVNGVSLVSDNSVPVFRPTLSIRQILNSKLEQLDQHEPRMNPENRAIKHNESLGHLLSGRGENSENSDFTIAGKVEKANDPERTQRKSNKFTFARFSLQLATQSKKKKTIGTPRFMMCKGQP